MHEINFHFFNEFPNMKVPSRPTGIDSVDVLANLIHNGISSSRDLVYMLESATRTVSGIQPLLSVLILYMYKLQACNLCHTTFQLNCTMASVQLMKTALLKQLFELT